MTVDLGSAWIPRQLPPPDAVLERDPVTAALLNIRELLETLILREQAPLRLEAPPIDLSSLTAQLASYAPLDAGQIGAAVASAIRFPEPPPQDTRALEALLGAMEKLDFRMKGTGGGGSLSPDITDRASRILGQVTGTFWQATQPVSGTVSNADVPDLTGTWGYKAGVSGTPSLPGGARVLAIAAHATSAGSLTINGGDSIPIPAQTGWGLDGIFGQLTAPTLVFTSTDSYCVSYLT